MNAEDLMTGCVWTCRPMDSVNRAAQLMWEHGCGAIPIIDEVGIPIAIVTDRDVCMAAYTQGKPLSEIPIATAMSKTLFFCRMGDSIATVEALMRDHRVRRLPVIDPYHRLVGIVSLDDLATRGHWARDARREERGDMAIASTLTAICAAAVRT